jgi:two-component system, NtrC family, sensor kinase
MEFFSYLAAFLLIQRIQKAFKFSTLRAKWSTFFTIGIWSSIGLYVLGAVFLEELDVVKYLIGSAILFGLVIFIDREPDFSAFKSFARAHYPLIVAVFITGSTILVAPEFFDKYDKFFDFVIGGAFVWTFTALAATKKQLEELKLANQQNAILDKLVAERTAELTRQKEELQQTVALLQTTQQQLIQSEKLASLGELTAGIAHEIQNPLNFVNNFSEVSIELMAEMEEELTKGDKEEAIAIAADIKQNLEKIIHHGKRADGIVKGMLQHSRASNGVKEPTDINKLADEYLRLAYHGLRAKDKSFNSELVSHYAENLPAVKIIPQDVGRVLLNLFTNAFYAVHQKQKNSDSSYKPEVTLTTAVEKKQVIIKVKDNGTGIPDNIKDKIMQPFFTTKPTGEGTGLGLSLSYDIIVKAHGGNIAIETREGEFTEFVIFLPL